MKAKRKKSYLKILTLLIFASLNLNAQNNQDTIDFYEMDLEQLLNIQIEVVSTKGEKIFNSPSTVSIISKEEIEKYNFLSIEEALQNIAGININRTYIKRNLPTSRGILQDHYANKVLVLINGIPLWNSVTGEANLDRISINDIERIEVLKGPASVLYGTNALTGAVNIVLKQAHETNATFITGWGSNNSYVKGINAHYTKEKFKLSIFANSSDNIGGEKKFTDERKVTKKFNDHLKTENITLISKYKSHQFTFNAYQNQESYLGITPSFNAGAGIDQKLQGYFGNYTFNHNFNEKLNIKAGSTFDYENRVAPRDSINAVKTNIEGYKSYSNLVANYQLNDNWNFELGIDYDYRICQEYKNFRVSNDTMIDNNGLKDKKVSEYSVFTQVKYTYNKINALLGSRFTQNELFGNNISSRAAIVFAINDKNSLKLLYGESYRAPSIFESYFYSSKSKTVFGNENLKPETSKSIELAYLTSFDNFFIQILGFHSIYDNKIFRSKDSCIILSDGFNVNKYPGATVYTNGKTFTANGCELEIDYKNPKIINAYLNYTYILGDKGDANTIITKTGNIENYNFKYYPVHKLSLGLNKNLIENINLSCIYNYIHETQGPFKKIPSFNIIDVNLSFKHKFNNINVSHAISCKNILDENVVNAEYSRISVINDVPVGIYRFVGYKLLIKIE